MKIRKIPTKCPAPPFSESPLLFRYAPPFKQNFLTPVLSAFQKFASPPLKKGGGRNYVIEVVLIKKKLV